jgi:signal transduction histidine kinase
MSANLIWLKRPKGQQRLIPALLCLIGLWIIGLIDYSLGYQISLLVFYILPIGFATLYVGPAFATMLAILSVVIWNGQDFLAGMPYPGMAIVFWNGTIVVSLLMIVIGLLNALNRTLLGLESTVEERTRALTHEMGERGRLEREIIDLSEREHQRFGQELHDLVCQELASISIATHMLTRELLAMELDKANDAREIAQMVDHALAKTRSVARGFFTAGFDGLGLEEALRESARHTAERNRISCVVRWPKNLAIADEDTVINFFRIAQEALQNADKHASASHIEISLEHKQNMLQLIVEDDGVGLPALNPKRKGLGLSIMAHRAGLIGGEFKTERPAKGGTRVVCRVPIEKMMHPVMAP